MKSLLEKIDSKMITSVGGILLAGFLAYTLFKVLTNDLSHVNSAIQGVGEIQKETNQVLRQNAEAIVGNTKVLEILERRLK